MKIYVASSMNNLMQPEVVHILRQCGHEVFDFRNDNNGGFRWSDVAPNPDTWTPEQFLEAYEHPLAEQAFHVDFAAMQWADAGVLVLPCGRSAHVEAGFMAGTGKPVWTLILNRERPELMYKCFKGGKLLVSLEQMIEVFGKEAVRGS